MTKPPAAYRGLAVELDTINPESTLPRTPVAFMHRVTESRRASRELDQLLGVTYLPVSLDEYGWPTWDFWADGRLGVPERDRVGRELAAAGCS